jgi:myo-inositol-1(or 4)-monophosphatase
MSDLAQDDIEEAYQFAIDLGRTAGKILLEGLERPRATVDNGTHEGVEKLTVLDIVTQADTGMRLRA